MKPLGIYLHVPFCVSKCNYCDFNSYAGLDALHQPYFQALEQEIRSFRQEGGFPDFVRAAEYTADTVYFGGGTPTSVDTEYIAGCMRALRETFCIADHAEITVECNPKTAGYEDFCVLREVGVNRLSIGLQSVCDRQLDRLGRAHHFADFDACWRAARRAGFENISLDLMFGLPDQSLADWSETLVKTVAYAPEHISCYALQIEEGTPFATMELNLPDGDENREMYDQCVRFLQENGYLRYEISNFAKPGRESAHNLKYWDYAPFIGLGAGAYSCIEGYRYYNISRVREYITAMSGQGTAVADSEELTVEDEMSEFVFLGLRKSAGISEKEFASRFGVKLRDVYGDVIDKNLKRGSLIAQNGRLFFPSDMFYVSNAVLADFV